MKYKTSLYNTYFEFNNSKYLYNSHSGLFCEIDDCMYEYLETISLNQNPESKAEFSYLSQKGVIIRDDINEFNLIHVRNLTEQFSNSPSQLDFVIATTRGCNYRCKYCFEGQTHSNIEMNAETQEATVRFIISTLENCKSCTRIHITWFGGEPLLNTPCIENISGKLIDYCNQHSVKYSASIITNGLLLNEKCIVFLETQMVNSIQVTIDGDEDVYGYYKGTAPENFEKVVNNICAIPQRIKVSLRFNTDKDNYESVKKAALLIIDRIDESRKKNMIMYLAPIEYRRKKSISMATLNELNYDFSTMLLNNRMYDSILGNIPQPRYVSCGALKKNNYAIDSNGNLVKCEHYIGDDDKASGDVVNGPCFANSEMEFYKTTVKDKCRKCSLYPVCRGGCMERLINRGVEVDCDAYKEKIRQHLYFAALVGQRLNS